MFKLRVAIRGLATGDGFLDLVQRQSLRFQPFPYHARRDGRSQVGDGFGNRPRREIGPQGFGIIGVSGNASDGFTKRIMDFGMKFFF